MALDGTDYEIDLNTEHAQELRDALARYVTAARRAGSSARRPALSAARSPQRTQSTCERAEHYV